MAVALATGHGPTRAAGSQPTRHARLYTMDDVERAVQVIALSMQCNDIFSIILHASIQGRLQAAHDHDFCAVLGGTSHKSVRDSALGQGHDT